MVPIPETLCFDVGTQLISKESRYFSKEWHTNLQISSPEYERSNDLAERYVQEDKTIAKYAAGGFDIYC